MSRLPTDRQCWEQERGNKSASGLVVCSPAVFCLLSADVKCMAVLDTTGNGHCGLRAAVLTSSSPKAHEGGHAHPLHSIYTLESSVTTLSVAGQMCSSVARLPDKPPWSVTLPGQSIPSWHRAVTSVGSHCPAGRGSQAVHASLRCALASHPASKGVTVSRAVVVRRLPYRSELTGLQVLLQPECRLRIRSEVCSHSAQPQCSMQPR